MINHRPALLLGKLVWGVTQEELAAQSCFYCPESAKEDRSFDIVLDVALAPGRYEGYVVDVKYDLPPEEEVGGGESMNQQAHSFQGRRLRSEPVALVIFLVQDKFLRPEESFQNPSGGASA